MRAISSTHAGVGGLQNHRGATGMVSEQDFAALISELWSSGACLGYAVLALEKMQYPKRQISAIIKAMYREMDFTTTEEAERHYCESPY